MKYMSFSNSCFYASIATLLEEYGIDIEDKDIIKDSFIPFTFLHDSNYEAGYQLQYSYLINHYLKRFDVTFKEKRFLLKEELVRSLKKETKKCIVSLQLDQGAHAVVFTSYQNGMFQFLKMRREENDALKSITLNQEELIAHINDALQYGFLHKGNKQVCISKGDVISNTVVTLEELKQDIINHCSSNVDLNTRIFKREYLFRSLFISYLDVANICEYKEIYQRLLQSRKEYIETFKMKETIVLSNYLNLDFLIDTITLIQKKHLSRGVTFL